MLRGEITAERSREGGIALAIAKSTTLVALRLDRDGAMMITGPLVGRSWRGRASDAPGQARIWVALAEATRDGTDPNAPPTHAWEIHTADFRTATRRHNGHLVSIAVASQDNTEGITAFFRPATNR